MGRKLTVAIERWPVAGAFTIARGAKTEVDVVIVSIADEMRSGRGEATPIYYHGETADNVAALIAAVQAEIEAGLNRSELQNLLPRGAARNAVDAALWQLEARKSGLPVWRLAGLDEPKPLLTAYTISVSSPDQMKADAARAAGIYPLLKLKLSGQNDVDRVAAVRAGAPEARLIVDANESWTGRDIVSEAEQLLPFGVELIEQPVRAGEDALLGSIRSPIPLCADESCQSLHDVERCSQLYQAINIKLDKAGGLTEALAMTKAAQKAGLQIMVGCMLSTSLGVAPAFLVGQCAHWVDLDGPLLLARDRTPAIAFDGAMMPMPDPELWG